MDLDYTQSLAEVIQKKELISFDFEPMNELHTWGFVLNCNETFTLINQFDRDIYGLDGYSVFYNEDVSEYWTYTSTENYLETKYIKLKNIKPQPQPKISLNSLSELLTSISQNFPTMKIYRDNLSEDGNVIGKLVEVKENTFKLLAIRTDGVWKENPSRFRLADVTRIDFGTRYEEVLLSVAEKR
jgi:hypothetical protein